MSTTARAATVPLDLEPPASAMLWSAPGSPHRTVTVPRVLLAPGEALVRVEAATVCGSDLHTVHGDRSAGAPLVLGHEQVGRIVATAGAVKASDGSSVRIGQRVVWSVAVSCGECDLCRDGLPQKCATLRKYGHQPFSESWPLSGGFATHVQLRSGTTIVPVPEDLPAALFAPACCGTATAASAMARAAHRAELGGRSVLVTGAGMVGLSAAALATDRGALVVVSDPDPGRRELAWRFGASAVVDPTAVDGSRESLAKALDDLGPPVAAIEASGHPSAVRTCVESLAVAGIAVLVGSVFPTAGVSLDPERIVRRLLTVAGVHNYRPADLVAAVAFISRRRDEYPFGTLVSETYPLHRLDDAFAAAGRGAVRVAVTPQP
ncbi:zinc-binding dehydrogenase [Propionicicella superfundia]|uniref:zinc-binding dehydrogenase n=1 Tax=Propionicicella superfundia TaxID=348582 RepID=UPI000402E46A|nr:zinc-binding dehydrogenase [Propionicicella superfundia]